LQKKLISLAQNFSDTEDDYYQAIEEEGSDYDSSLIKTLNVITNKNQWEFLFD